VCDQCSGGSELPVDERQGLQHADARLAVERPRGLVAQQDVRALGDGAGDGNALLLPARHLRGKMVHALGEADEIERLLGRHWVACSLRDQGHVLTRRQRGNQVVELEDEPDMIAPVGGEAVVIEAGQLVIAEAGEA
jgi:hypothetical protein